MAKPQGVGHSECIRVPIIFVLPKLPSWVNYRQKNIHLDTTLLSWSFASMSGFINCLINFVSIYAGPEPFLLAVLSPSLSQVANNMLLLLLY